MNPFLSMSQRLLIACLSLFLASQATLSPTQAKPSTEKCAGKDENWVRAAVEINAPANVVWEAVHEERKHDPDLAYSKLIHEGSPGSNEYRLEQKFVLVPVLGTAVCEMHNKEVPMERIDYKLIKSDRFKTMEGSWVLTTLEGGKTKLELSSLLDTGMPVPRGMVNSITARKIQKRLKRVKTAAELLDHKLAEHPRQLEKAH